MGNSKIPKIQDEENKFGECLIFKKKYSSYFICLCDLSLGEYIWDISVLLSCLSKD